MNIQHLKKEYKSKQQELQQRIQDFKNIKEDSIFYELCFCLLTPQSKGRTADNIVQRLIKADFRNKNIDPHPYVRSTRFHNNRRKYLLEAKQNFPKILKQINEAKDVIELRRYLIKNIKGMSYKESSHLIRNIGKNNNELAILDRHILKNLIKYRVIKEIPETLTRKRYLNIESKFKKFSDRIKISMDELDLLFWSMETGEIFK